MKRINSKVTFFHKKIFPVFWFGIVLITLGAAWLGKANGKPVPFPAFFVPLFMVGIGFVLMKVLIFPLADEVYDCTEFLVVRKGDVEEKIFFGRSGT